MMTPKPFSNPLRDRARIDRLAMMHTYCRPAGSMTEQQFVETYITKDRSDVFADPYGNLHITIGDAPIVWSCHTDTVHTFEGRQRVAIDRSQIFLPRRSRKHSACLGADDTVGVFICLEMMAAGIPGRYMFHFGEEMGCIGSQSLASDPEYRAMLQEYPIAIAFDRRGTSDVITHQMGRRSASDTFARAFAERLSVNGLSYAPSDRGMYTDTESYADIIPECTNIAIGYSDAHSNRERVDVNHVMRLVDVLTSRDDWHTLPVARFTTDPDVDTFLDADDLDLADLEFLERDTDERRAQGNPWLDVDWPAVQEALRRYKH